MRDQKIFILVVIYLFFGAQTVFANQLPHPKTFPIPILGGGYSDDMQIALGIPCLQPGQTQFEGGTKSIIQLGKAYNFHDIQKFLDVDISADGSIGLFSSDLSTEYARYVQDTNYAESFYYLEEVQLPTKIFLPTGFGEQSLNPFGQMAYSAGPDQFRASCGNKFIQQESLGANLFSTFKIDFSSSYDKSLFDTHVGTSVGSFFEASARIQKTVQELNIRGTLEISAYQEGGNPFQLAQIFSKCNDSYCITTCSLDNLTACQKTIDGIIHYAQSDLPNQIDFKDGQIIGNANPLDYSYMDYTQLGLNVGPSVNTPEILAARNDLGQLYKTTLQYAALVDHVLHSIVSASILKSYKEKLQTLNNHLQDNLALLESNNDGALGCYIHPTACPSIQQHIDASLKPLDQETLDLFSTGYLDKSAGGPYLNIPIGGDQYQSFNEGGSHFTAQQTMKLSSDQSTLHIDGIDISNAHFWGDFTKTGESTYLGQLHYDYGRTETHQISIVENPG